jgi:glycosyltransferase involved in cell wall biosynthesis
MRVVHLSVGDLWGGAARAAFRLHTGLARCGWDSQMLVTNRQSIDPNVHQFDLRTSLWKRVCRRLRRNYLTWNIQRHKSLFNPRKPYSDDRAEHGRDLLDQIPPCDVLNLHLVAGFVDHQLLFANLPRSLPVVYTLHDMYAFTGGCHYTDGCARYHERCGACPQLRSQRSGDFSRGVWKRKCAAFSHRSSRNLAFVANSVWMQQEARKSSLLDGFPVEVIHYGLDLEVFQPRNKALSREILGIGPSERVVVFCAVNLHEPRKGMKLMLEALELVSASQDLSLLTFGSGLFHTRLRHRHLGPIESEALMSLVYSAGDVFVMPSTQEAFGLTALESLACGTPVVAFGAGGIPDMIAPGQNGFLAPVGDTQSLAKGIRSILDDRMRQAQMSRQAREIVAARFSLEKQADAYANLYSRLIEEPTAGQVNGSYR